MQKENRKLLRSEPVWESRYPLYQWRINCWAYADTKAKKRFKAYILVYAETYREAVIRADIWAPLIEKVQRVSNQINLTK